jgi:tetratricopeptide (TPR) repeat protein
VLAHEAGHLAGGHARVGNWIYRLRAAWSRLHEAVAREQHWGSFAVRPFFDWYAPYFAARSFPLARLNEYEADAAAARATAPIAAAEALSAVNVVAAWLDERFWPGIFDRVAADASPDATPFRSIGGGIAATIPADDAAGWLARALARRTTFDDTHPALGDRLAALGQTARLALPAPGDSAAAVLLGPAYGDIVAQFDAHWRERVGPRWAERHRELAAGRERLAVLDRDATQGRTLEPAEAIERADLAEEVGGGAPVAIALLDDVAARVPDHAGVQFRLGRLRLTLDEAAAIAHFERAVALDPAAEAAACSHLIAHLRSQGREEAARDWIRRWEVASGRLAEAESERNRVSLSDAFEPHGLDAAAVARLAAALRSAGARRAWVVRKRVVHFPERPLYVIGFEAVPWWRWTSESRIAQVQERIAHADGLPGECLVLSLAGDNASFRRKLAKLAGARVA